MRCLNTSYCSICGGELIFIDDIERGYHSDCGREQDNNLIDYYGDDHL
jgi:hypothetical protein